MKKPKTLRFYYHDNWSGALREFATQAQAREAAANETGYTITIHDRENPESLITVDASGFVPA